MDAIAIHGAKVVDTLGAGVTIGGVGGSAVGANGAKGAMKYVVIAWIPVKDRRVASLVLATIKVRLVDIQLGIAEIDG